jgi:hypothetical protein
VRKKRPQGTCQQAGDIKQALPLRCLWMLQPDQLFHGLSPISLAPAPSKPILPLKPSAPAAAVTLAPQEAVVLVRQCLSAGYCCPASTAPAASCISAPWSACSPCQPCPPWHMQPGSRGCPQTLAGWTARQPLACRETGTDTLAVQFIALPSVLSKAGAVHQHNGDGIQQHLQLMLKRPNRRLLLVLAHISQLDMQPSCTACSAAVLCCAVL